MIPNSNLEALLAEVTETLDTEGYVGLHDFSWSARGLRLGLTEPEIGDLCERAYVALRELRRLRLVWLDGPVLTPERAQEADPGTPLDFDIKPSGDVTAPLLALIPADTVVIGY